MCIRDRVKVTLPAAFAGQPFSLVRLDGNSNPVDVVGKAIGDGTTTVTIKADLDSGTPSQLAVVLAADDAAPLVLPVPINS